MGAARSWPCLGSRTDEAASNSTSAQHAARNAISSHQQHIQAQAQAPGCRHPATQHTAQQTRTASASQVRLASFKEMAAEVKHMQWVGEGGSAVVLKGVWRDTTDVIVKFMVSSPPSPGGDPSPTCKEGSTRPAGLEELGALREAMLCRVLAHPHIVQSFSFKVGVVLEAWLQPPPDPGHVEQPHTLDPSLESMQNTGAVAAQLLVSVVPELHSGSTLSSGGMAADVDVEASVQDMPSQAHGSVPRSIMAQRDSFDSPLARCLANGVAGAQFTSTTSNVVSGGHADEGASLCEVLSYLKAVPGSIVTQIVMEVCEYGSLLDAVKKGAFLFQQRDLQLVEEACRAAKLAAASCGPGHLSVFASAAAGSSSPQLLQSWAGATAGLAERPSTGLNPVACLPVCAPMCNSVREGDSRGAQRTELFGQGGPSEWEGEPWPPEQPDMSTHDGSASCGQVAMSPLAPAPLQQQRSSACAQAALVAHALAFSPCSTSDARPPQLQQGSGGPGHAAWTLQRRNTWGAKLSGQHPGVPIQARSHTPHATCLPSPTPTANGSAATLTSSALPPAPPAVTVSAALRVLQVLQHSRLTQGGVTQGAGAQPNSDQPLLLSSCQHIRQHSSPRASAPPPGQGLPVQLSHTLPPLSLDLPPVNLTGLRSLLRTAREVATGMAHLHAEGILHGDLKPANVLLKGSRRDARGWTARISDFGFAQVSPSLHVDTQGNLATLAYMSPEYMRGELMAASDVWSFGMILHVLYTGVQPYRQFTKAQILMGVATHQLSLEWPPGAPADLVRLARACTATEPCLRPSFKAIVKDLAAMEGQLKKKVMTYNRLRQASSRNGLATACQSP